MEEVLEHLPPHKREKVIRFFLPQKIPGGADAVLLTQQFSNQGLLSQEQQLRLYRQLRQEALRNVSLIIKKHPDDHQSYKEIFPDAVEIPWVFPAELLPYVLENKPSHLYTWDSTACSNLEHHFIIHQLGGKPYAQ